MRPRAYIIRLALVAGALIGGAAVGRADDDEPEIAVALEAAAETPEETATGSYLAGLHAQRRHAYGEAADFILKAIADDPDEPSLRMRAFQLLLSEGRFAEALTFAREVLRESPGNGLANLVLAVDAVRRGDAAAAERHLGEMPDSGINRLMTPFMRAWVLAGAGKPDAGVVALEPLRQQQPLRPVVAMQSALIFDGAGRAAEAGDRFQAALAIAPGNVRLARFAANFYLRQGKSEVAEEVLRHYAAAGGEPDLVAPERAQIAARRPASEVPPLVGGFADGLAEALFDVAGVTNQPQSRDLALILTRLALALRPEHTLALLLIAELLEENERPEAARTAFLAVPESSPLRWSAQLRAATALDRMDRTDEAMAELKRMSEARPDRAEAALRLGDILRARSRFAEAVEAYDVGLARVPVIDQRHWSALYSRGIALERAKIWDRAEADFLKALELQPEQPYVLNYLAYSWVDRGLNLDRSLAMLRRAVELRPEDGYIVDSLGWVMYRLGRFEEATRELERAVELRPLDPVINDHLGDAYWRTGRRTEARVQWQRALTLQPEADQVKPIEDKLARGLETQAKRPNGG
ncbi:MAG: tetratricopeptide repeat protein [Alphaproteobacteria bacterium]|nr:tetratricopeptide repeat protein [Alphaproteobacteria bacterium]